MAIARLQAILPCFPSGAQQVVPTNDANDEKAALLASYKPRADAEVAEDVVATMLSTSLSGPKLRMKLDSIVGTYSWTENLAQWILEKLALALQNAHDNLGPAVRDAYHKAWEAAKGIEGFVIEHPVMCTVIALGVLAVVTPWVLTALGFGEIGIAEGSFAARWMASYAGYVPKGSLLSFFQRLGMKWRWAGVVL